MTEAKLTKEIFEKLKKEDVIGEKLIVLCSHASEKNEKRTIQVKAKKNEFELCEPDILIATQEKKILLVVEIEENTSDPKKILGDSISFLIGEKVLWTGKKPPEEYKVTKNTQFFLFFNNKVKDKNRSEKKRKQKEERTKFVEEMVNKIRNCIKGPEDSISNSRIKDVKIKAYSESNEDFVNHVLKEIKIYLGEIK